MVVSSEKVPTQTFRFVNFPRSRRLLWRYGPLLVWAVLIFIGSTDLLSTSNTAGFLRRTLLWMFPHASAATLKALQIVARKTGHFAEYAIFALLAARVFRTSSRELLRSRWFWLSLLLVIVYALGDEFHQSFVPTRTGSIYDSLIDSLGGLAALLIYRTTVRRLVTHGKYYRRRRSVSQENAGSHQTSVP